MATSGCTNDRDDPNLSPLLPSCVLLRLQVVIHRLEQGQPLAHFRCDTKKVKAIGRMARPMNFHWPIDPYVLPEQTHVRWCLHHALAITFPNKRPVPSSDFIDLVENADTAHTTNTQNLIDRYCALEKSMAPTRHTLQRAPQELGIPKPKPSPKRVHVKRLTHSTRLVPSRKSPCLPGAGTCAST